MPSPPKFLHTYTCTFEANTSLSTTAANEPHRRQQRPPRSRHPRLHHRNKNITPVILRVLHFRHEHVRHTQHRHSPMDLLGLCHPAYYCSDAVIAACHLQIRAAAPRVEEIIILGVWRRRGYWKGCWRVGSMNVGKESFDLTSYCELQWMLPSDYMATSLPATASPDDCALTSSFFVQLFSHTRDKKVALLTSVRQTSEHLYWKKEVREDPRIRWIFATDVLSEGHLVHKFEDRLYTWMSEVVVVSGATAKWDGKYARGSWGSHFPSLQIPRAGLTLRLTPQHDLRNLDSTLNS